MGTHKRYKTPNDLHGLGLLLNTWCRRSHLILITPINRDDYPCFIDDESDTQKSQ